jgi:hypothetical protein
MSKSVAHYDAPACDFSSSDFRGGGEFNDSKNRICAWGDSAGRSVPRRSTLQTSSWANAQDPGFWGIGHASRAVSATADLVLQLWTLGFAQGD